MPTCQKIAQEAVQGKAGIREYKFDGHTKFVVYAPIKYYSAGYSKSAGFGWIGMGVDIEKFNSMGTDTAKQIRAESKSWVTTVTIILIVSMILLFGVAAILSLGIARSVEAAIP